jgi:hypothetical protein
MIRSGSVEGIECCLESTNRMATSEGSAKSNPEPANGSFRHGKLGLFMSKTRPTS